MKPKKEGKVQSHTFTYGNHPDTSQETIIKYLKKKADKGSLRAIKFLFEDHRNFLSHDEEYRYLVFGSQHQDPFCLYELARNYSEGKKGFPLLFKKAFFYFKLAAYYGHDHAKYIMDEVSNIIHPHAQFVNLEDYLLNRDAQFLKNILKSYDKKPIVLADFSFSEEEAIVICEAMVENAHFTVIGSEEDLAMLKNSFELKGYSIQNLDEKPILKICRDQGLFGCVYIPLNEIGIKKHEKEIKLLSGNLNDPESKFYVSSFRLGHLTDIPENNSGL